MNLYLSPHHDDICYSLGDLARREGGEMVNLYTATAFAVRPPDLPVTRLARIAAVSALRRAEDERFAARLGLGRHDLGLSEPVLRDQHPFDLSALAQDIQVLGRALLPHLETRLGDPGRPRVTAIYCPMGIGRHRNHVAALFVMKRCLDRLPADCALHLYEDLPYASDGTERSRGLERLRALLAGRDLVQTVHRLDAEAREAKLAAVALYASQRLEPADPARFEPATGLDDGMHESVWQVMRG